MFTKENLPAAAPGTGTSSRKKLESSLPPRGSFSQGRQRNNSVNTNGQGRKSMGGPPIMVNNV